MSTDTITMFAPEDLARLEEAILRAQAGRFDRAAFEEACRDMDLVREEIFAQHGLQDIGVEAIRKLRDSE